MQALSNHFRVDPAADGPTNMRLDEELLASAERGIGGCRIYSWVAPWVTLGKYQSASKDLVPGTCIPWVIRPTGGKAVLHGHDITVCIAMPLRMLISEKMPVEKLERSIKAVYRAMSAPMIRALRACGLPAALGEDTRFVGNNSRVADCFAHVSANDIVDERTGVKVCGCALKITQSAALVQASIPAGNPLVDPALVIIGGKTLSCASWESARFGDELGVALS
jgi:lipoyl(octanoyl) transferase